MTDAARQTPMTISAARRIIVGIIIVSFGIAALGGIAVLLTGALDETGLRILGTTAIVGLFSVAVLCCVTLVGRRVQTFGLVGAAVSVLAAVLVVFLIWWEPQDWSTTDAVWRVTWSTIACSVAFSLASLLLLLADRQQPAVRGGLIVTLVFFGIVLALVLYAIWLPEQLDGESYARLLGISAILAALGAVVVPVLSLLLRDRTGTEAAPTATLSAQTLARLQAEADARLLTVDELVDELLGDSRP